MEYIINFKHSKFFLYNTKIMNYFLLKFYDHWILLQKPMHSFKENKKKLYLIQITLGKTWINLEHNKLD